MMHIAGIGIIFSGGRGLDSLEKTLAQGQVTPTQDCRVPAEALTDKEVLKEARRADTFTKMAVLAAHDALADSGIPQETRQKMGVILATAFGPHVTTFNFLDDILTYGDAGVSPTLFSHSVHNAAASYIALNLQTRGPTITMTQFADSFHQALILAESWLKENRCEYILVGSTDQTGKVMEYIYGQKLGPQVIPGEGSAFFLVTCNLKYNKYCSISALPQSAKDSADLVIPFSSYAPIFGSTPALTAFNCAVGALKLTRDNTLHKIDCLRYNCQNNELAIRLKKENA
jgi:3-oxoacyl-[acyl-carrier-protein] synthase II